MEEKQKPLKTAVNKAKDLYNAYRRPDEKSEPQTAESVVQATTSQDINQVHIHHDVVDSPSGVEMPDASQRDEADVQKDAHRAAITQMEKERDDMRDQLLRKIAEFENFKKRTDREKEQLSLYVAERLFGKLVEVLDDLHAALDAGKKSHDYASMLSGLEMIYNKTHRIYEEHGVRPLIAEQNHEFNVDVHEALMHIPHAEVPEGQIVQQIQRGYTLHDKVLRHAKVVTSAGPAVQ